MELAIEKSEEQRVREKTRKSLLYWAIASMVIFFSAFLSYYMVMVGNGNWIVFELPDIFLVSTSVIVTSSLTMYLAQLAVKKENFKMISLFVGLTIVLGIVFCYLQFSAWAYLISKNIYFTGKGNRVSASILYVITFLHFVHLIFGLIALIFTFIKSLKKKYTKTEHLGLSLASIFWHFLDILWVILFLFLLFNR